MSSATANGPDIFGNPSGMVNISGGFVDSALAFAGGQVNISGGTVGTGFEAGTDTVVNISGGTVGDEFRAFSAQVNISGGAVGARFEALLGSEVNISGGTVGESFNVFSDSEVNILGSEFLLDGLELDFLELGQAFTIFDRDATLSGLLASGESFSFDLNSNVSDLQDFFAPDARLTVTLTTSVPEPSSTVLIMVAIGIGVARRRKS